MNCEIILCVCARARVCVCVHAFERGTNVNICFVLELSDTASGRVTVSILSGM